MQTLGLILASLILPLIWGWISNRLMVWLWPQAQALAAARTERRERHDPLADYQI